MGKKVLCIVLAVNVFTVSFAQTKNFLSPIEKQAYLDARYDVYVDKKPLSIDEKYFKRKTQLENSETSPNVIAEYRKYYYKYYLGFHNTEGTTSQPINKFNSEKRSPKTIAIRRIIIWSCIGLGLFVAVVVIPLTKGVVAIFYGEE